MIENLRRDLQDHVTALDTQPLDVAFVRERLAPFLDGMLDVLAEQPGDDSVVIPVTLAERMLQTFSVAKQFTEFTIQQLPAETPPHVRKNLVTHQEACLACELNLRDFLAEPDEDDAEDDAEDDTATEEG